MAEKSCNAGGGKEEEDEKKKKNKRQNENRKVCWLRQADLNKLKKSFKKIFIGI